MNSLRNRYEIFLFAAVCAGTAWPVAGQEGGGSSERRAAPLLEEVMVTARRREESIQQVPVAISAFSGERLREVSVVNLMDLTSLAAGLRFTQEGGKDNTSVSLRGLSKLPIGNGVPAVVLYVDEAPLFTEGINVPTYDLENVQVLKGPQGTLFGRNTLAGAVLMTTRKPSYTQEGYIETSIGDYNFWQVEGAITQPIVENKLAVRLAFQTKERDGVTENLSGGADFDDFNHDSVRLSILLEPLENLSNIMVADYFEANDQPGGEILYNYSGSTYGAAEPLFGPPTEAFFLAQQAAGPHKAFSDLTNARANRRQWGVVNTTTFNLTDNILLKNIFSYRERSLSSQHNTGGTGPLIVPNPTLGFRPDQLILFHPDSQASQKMMTEEVQLQADLFDGKVNWILGYFYSKEEPDGIYGSNFRIFDFVGDGPDVSYSSSYVENENEAVFTQFGIDISDWTLDGMTLDLGYRYSWDEVRACGGSTPSGYLTQSECRAIAGLGLADGTGTIETEGEEPTYTVGLNWQVNDQLFLYAVSRYGYRGVGLNTPRFETQFTTGGSGCSLGGTPVSCPDLRSFQTTGEETVEDFEVGFKSDWDISGMRARLNVSYFNMDYQDGLQFFNAVAEAGVPSSAPDVPTRSAIGVNAADFNISGVEFDGSISPIDELTFFFTGAFTDQDVESINAAPFGVPLQSGKVTLPTAKFSGTFAVRWLLPVRPLDGELVFNANYFYTSEWDAQVGVSLPSYEVTNTRIDWRDISKSGVDVGFWVRNVFDEEYAVAPVNLSPAFPTSTVFYGEPRVWGFDVRYSWGAR